MTCKDVIEILADYLEEALAEDAVGDLERHLELCPPCRAYLATYKRTAGLVRESDRVEMPEAMKRHLREFLVKQLEEPRG